MDAAAEMNHKTTVSVSMRLLLLIAVSMPAMGADDFALIRKTDLSPPSSAMKGFSQVDSFGLSDDGRILIAGQFHDSRDAPMSFLMNMTPESVVVWQHVFEHEPLYDPPTTMFAASDGGYWEIGKGHTEDSAATKASLKWNERVAHDISATYFYLGKLDDAGQIGWRKPITEPGLSHLITCGVRTPDGLIVSGSTNTEYEGIPDGRFSASAPWIEKLDPSGAVVWTRIIAEDEGKVLSIPFDSSPKTCAGIRVSPSGDIVWAVTVDVYEKKRRAAGHIVVDSEQRGATANPMTLIIALDKDGKETHRFRSMDSNSAFLFSRGDGYALVDHFRPHLADALLKLPPALSVAATLPAVKADSGARFTTFDSQLNVITSSKIAYRGFNDKLRAVLPAENGGYYVIGCSIDLAENHLAYIDSQTRVARSIKLMQGQCGYFGLAHSSGSKDVEVYSSVSEGSPHLYTLRAAGNPAP